MASVDYLASAVSSLNVSAVDEGVQKEIAGWKTKIENGAKEVTDLKVLDRVLTTKTFLVGSSLSEADLALFSHHYPTVSRFTEAEQVAHPFATRYFSNISHAAAKLPHDAASRFAAFDPSPAVESEIERRESEAKQAKERKEAAAASKKEKSAKEEGGKKKSNNNNEPTTPFVPMPSHVDLRVGKIVDIKQHPDADALYLEQVDFGEPEGPRTILSGLVHHVPIEKMQNRLVVGVCNLKPATMRGIKSYGMLLCATHKDGKDGGVEPVLPPEGSQPGDRVYVEGYEGIEPETVLNPKKKIFETIQPNYTTTETCECAWKGAGAKTEDGEQKARLIRTTRGVCTAPGYASATLS